MPELLEAAAELEEVASPGEAVVSAVDLTTVSQQLDQMMNLQVIGILALGIILGAIMGLAVFREVRRLWE